MNGVEWVAPNRIWLDISNGSKVSNNARVAHNKWLKLKTITQHISESWAIRFQAKGFTCLFCGSIFRFKQIHTRIVSLFA